MILFSTGGSSDTEPYPLQANSASSPAWMGTLAFLIVTVLTLPLTSLETLENSPENSCLCPNLYLKTTVPYFESAGGSQVSPAVPIPFMRRKIPYLVVDARAVKLKYL